jgi:hypothetical protein
MSREVLSARRITHVVKNNDASESGFTTTPLNMRQAGSQGACNGLLAGTGATVSAESGTQLAHRIAEKPSKTAVFD